MDKNKSRTQTVIESRTLLLHGRNARIEVSPWKKEDGKDLERTIRVVSGMFETKMELSSAEIWLLSDILTDGYKDAMRLFL